MNTSTQKLHSNLLAQWLLLVLITIAPLVSSAAPPQFITHQGYLTDPVGVPIDGTVTISFSLYANPAGGAALWSETLPVDVSAGLFTVAMGNAVPFPASLFSNELWLGIAVAPDSEMTPRIAVGASPYAMTAAAVSDGAVTTASTDFVHTTGGFFIGPGAGNTAATGFNNTAVGEAALSGLVTGTRNTAMGTLALAVNNGDHNTAFGERALASSVDGSNNTGLGMETLLNTQNGHLNTAVGKAALRDNVDGSQSVAVGYQALQNAIAYSNTALGFQAGINQSTGSNNLYIDNPGVAGESNQIRIGTVGTHNQTHLAGVYGNAVTGEFVVVDTNGTLGSTTMAPAGSSVVLPTAGAFVVMNNAQTVERFRVDEASGNLSRNGSLLLHDAGQSTNLFMGSGAGNPATTAGFNSAFGADAMSAVTTGISNTAIGTRALRYSTSGDGNTSVGTESLENNTSGGANTAIGRAALRANDSGIANVAIGVAALRNNLSGYNNIAIGTDSLFSNTVGIFNTAVGTNTLYDHTGSDTTAVGAWALENNLTSPNTAVGAYALQGNQHGIQHTAVGYQAMRNISGGNPGNEDLPPSPSGNTAVGFEALRDVGTGGANTAIGAGAISNSAGSGNTAVGGGALQGDSANPFNSAAGKNTAIGLGAMGLSAAVSQNNVALGYLALQRIGNTGTPSSAGVANIALGYRAGWNLTAGSNNIYLGNEGPTAESGQIRIGTPGVHLQEYLTGDVTVEKSISVASITIRGGADIAEPFEIRSDTQIQPGMVVSIDPAHPGGLRLSTVDYDHTVVGIVSGAGGIQPGITLTQKETITKGNHPVAMTGRVYAMVDESQTGSIRPGDLLTTSARPGYAMRVGDMTRSQGAVLGKAMTGRDPETGLVLVLVSLQ